MAGTGSGSPDGAPRGGYPPLPSALANLEEILQLGREKQLAVFLDYDGTLAAITPTPGAALITPEMHRALVRLSAKCTVGVISGRDLPDVRQRVNIDSIVYAGSHGFEIGGPNGLHAEQPGGIRCLPVLDQVHQELSQQLSEIRGAIIERKKFVITVHYRLVAEGETARVEAAVDGASSRHSQLRKSADKKMFELLPDVDWNKGKAVLSLLEILDLGGPRVLPLYLGDDTTDEDAFRTIHGKGLGIFVGEQIGESAATYRLRDCEEVREFLLELAPFCRA
ncbi:trehalose-phosphatase [Geotalea sp. SG265]|uniref:trehalose-phosphatase n=1 Tax=Geotalea sp. SG265 TaxID=2922867 RepID=UPI001FAF3B46|nr:trehalose-phosphatase [Geotalea sp. SG265]